MRDKKCMQSFGSETRGKETNFEDPGVNGRPSKSGMGAWTGLILLRIRQVKGSCECSNEYLD